VRVEVGERARHAHVALCREDVDAQGAGHMFVHREHPGLHADHDGGEAAVVVGDVRHVFADPLLGERHHVVEHRRGAGRAVEQRPGDVLVQQQDRRMDRRQEARVDELVVEDHLLLDPDDPVQGVGVAGLAQRLL
jgi:hypothetical protein